jgi:hypothetical protein
LETAGGYFAERAEDETLSNVVRQLFDAAENRSCKGYVPC